ncbi:transporter [Fusobacterium nucleatum subsp. nucleatum ATCC 25586]|uniref:Transporter n=1 Tax=Fusobacterium nucleatum subsp. nucleatum (strain ATCC 25586 / DSM 15643 / BCRC 10681 / CIP 101130 / JCM 8532 / KCTC 2640 / LMG 13131 / VPI 4355) TaxID=190304 RepID=Q8REB1_FUSNN|nr:ATP/GTP-binding protein [Fusobacterium nucleatum]AAL95394.1 Transporter [Fusobacterium nucleatum subsp. nucleatum ATCC 25586]AVQ15536.1 transporter [Fusobacterium nucleatum subsp. nucleatum ATCC 25586]WMS28544.1 ATP/GTP-binding protein [Fusobacterium nucleatum]
MLLQFYFSNYRSFEDEGILDMRASGSSELSSHIRNTLNEKVLPVTAIYGANASGKSSVFEAFQFMALCVLESLSFSDDNKKNPYKLKVDSFKFSESKEKPSEFEINYIDKKGKKELYYNYGFKIDNSGILEEYLASNTKTGVKRNEDYTYIFKRERNQKLYLDSSIEKFRENLEISLKEKTLLVSLGAKLNIDEFIRVRTWFINTEVINFSNSLYGALLENILPNNIIESEEVRKNLVSFINSFDDSIIDIEVEKISAIDENDKDNYRVFTIHKSDKGTSTARISMNEESSGTKKMFSLYQTLLDVLEKGGVFFADELDIKLHSLLMRNILLTFTDKEKNPNNAQLIFTTHNTIYMDMDLLRRDEIWFVEKDNGVSNLYSLDDITNEKGEKVRKDSNYEKHYLLGNYGAIPNLKNLLGRE